MIDYTKFEGHTPGPWENHKGLDAVTFLCCKNNSILTRGCSMCGKEKEPNMNLIAAAPDLLAACKRKDKIIAGIIETAKKEGLINLNWIIAAQKELDREEV